VKRPLLTTGAVTATSLLVLLPARSVAAAAECAPRTPGGPLWVTAHCVDPQYGRPVIDSETDQSAPVAHRQVSGHFAGTGVKFNVYLPPENQWRGRFFQYVYPTQSENATADHIAFGAASGAYTVQITGTAGYRADAAAAKFAKTVAARHYGEQPRIYGYIYGGSGGSYQALSAMENTTGVWDGAVPFIPATPTSIPNNFFVRAFARVVLRDKAAQIADAVRPGGSGDPYTGLTEAERTVLREVTRMGVPLRAWEDHPYVLGLNDPQGLLGYGAMVRGQDPTYADDFWGKPGYLGTERSPLGDLFRAAKVAQTATITQVSPTSVTLDSAPPASRTPLEFTLYAADGTTRIGTLIGTLKGMVFTLGSGNDSAVLDALAVGAKVRADNRWSLALTSYHRHQVPSRSGFYAWDQFRDADGQPIYPQRAIEIGPGVSLSVTGGGTFSGAITGKMIMVSHLLDADAYPWHADWYRKQVGSDENLRVWYNDHADHVGPRKPHLIDTTGILQQALRDVSAWVERGVTPPASTRYSVTGSQITVPAKADERLGVQPVIDLTSADRTRIEVRAGTPVAFTAKIHTPPDAGEIVSTDWDFKGDGTFVTRPFGPVGGTATVRETFTYTTPGTYFPALRATTQREGNADTPFARIPNLGRMRIIVR
jgi:hypothetical protein